MKALVTLALDTARARGASYADVRIVEQQEQTIWVKNGVVEALSETTDRDIGVRVVADGAWGFASSAVLAREEVEEVAALAVEIARASALAQAEPVSLGPPVTSTGTYRTPVEIDPFSVPADQKIALLLEADSAMRATEGVKVSQGALVAQREKKIFANTEGAFTDQEIIETGGGIVALAVSDGEVQQAPTPIPLGEISARSDGSTSRMLIFPAMLSGLLVRLSRF